MRYPVLIFDLDDTLLDTWAQLVQPAAREACSAMVSAGLATDVATCLDARQRLFVSSPRGDCYTGLVETFGVSGDTHPRDVRDAGHRAYFEREVEDHIRLFDGALSLLDQLGTDRTLFLVTSGHPRTQQQKVAILGIADRFEAVHYVDSSAGETKHARFHQILGETGLEPREHLAIGDRLDREIRDANRLGMTTCHVHYGEFQHLTPQHTDEEPDYRITHITELAGIVG